MKSKVVIFACLLCAGNVFAADQYVEYSTTHSANSVVFSIEIIPGTDTVIAAAISNSVTGQLSTGTSANACQYTVSTSPLSLTLSQNSFGKDVYSFEVEIDYSSTPVFQNTGATALGCDFTTIDQATGEFEFYLRGLDSLTGTAATNREYKIESTGTNLIQKVVIGSTTFLSTAVGSTTAVAATGYTFTMTVVDSPGHADQTSLDLGETAQLKFSMVIDPYVANMDLSGARLTNCVVAKASDFSNPFLKFIGTDGCFEDVDIFDNVHTNVGFSRDASSATSGSQKTYIAYSPKFEMSAFTRNPVNAANMLYFRCDLTFCLDDSDSVSQGQCGASHCDPTRKKRDVHHRPDTSVTASVNITTNENARKGCIKCTDTAAFQATVGGLATAVAIVFGAMTLSFTGAKRAAISRSQRRREVRQRSSASLSSQTVKGSDELNSIISMQKK